jgi:hypothetical protein
VVYNLSNITNSSSHGILGLTQGVNNVLLGGWLGILILLMLGTIFFMHFMFRTNDPGRALGATAFLCFGLSILLRAVNLLPDMAMFISLVVCAIAVALTFRN